MGMLMPSGNEIYAKHMYSEPVLAVARGDKKLEMAIGRRACDTAMHGVQVGTAARIALVVNGTKDRLLG